MFVSVCVFLGSDCALLCDVLEEPANLLYT